MILNLLKELVKVFIATFVYAEASFDFMDN